MVIGLSTTIRRYRIAALATVLAAALPLTAYSDTPCDSLNDRSATVNWYGRIDALGLARNNTTDRTSVIRVAGEGLPTTGTTVLRTSDLSFGLEAGTAALIGWRVDDRRAWEAAYFGVYDWRDSVSAAGDNDLALPGDLGLVSLDFYAADRMQLEYSSDLTSVEFNHVQRMDEWSWLAGFRFLELDESFLITADDFDTGRSQYSIDARNRLYGGQLGLRWDRHRRWCDWQANVKAGLFGNDAAQTQFVTDFPPGFELRPTTTANSGAVAFVSEASLALAVPLTETWSVRTAYNLLWLEGVALAPDQLDFNDTPTSGSDIDTSGGLFAQGISLGLAAQW
jgi:hypothetical protein